MTGVKVPAGVLGASAVAGSHVAAGTLPYTGVALTAYVATGGALLLSGIAFRVLGKTQKR